MVGERIRESAATARAVVEAGHEVQLHCDRHTRHTELSEAEIERDTRLGLHALAQIGVRPSLWRTPWGLITRSTIRVAARHRLQLVRWSIDTHDWRGDPARAMLAHARARFAAGGVVLMHDALGPGVLRTGCANTVELLPALIAAARSEGLHVGPLSPERTAPAPPPDSAMADARRLPGTLVSSSERMERRANTRPQGTRSRSGVGSTRPAVGSTGPAVDEAVMIGSGLARGHG
jgi:hypothetical protein